MSSSDATKLTETTNVKEEVNSPSTVISASSEAAPVTAASSTVPASRIFQAQTVSAMVLSTPYAERSKFGWLHSDHVHTYLFPDFNVKMKFRFTKVYELDGPGGRMTTPNVACMTPKRVAFLLEEAHQEYEVGTSYMITDEEQGYVITFELLD